MAPTATLSDLWALQEDFLAAAVASLDYILDVDPDLLGAPARQIVVPPGEFVIDCDQIVVNLAGLGEAPTRPNSPLPKRHVHSRIPRPTVNIVVARCCIPIGKMDGTTYQPPNAVETEAASRQLTADGWALYNGMFSRLVNNQLLDHCTSVEWVNMVPLGPMGACAGWQLQLRPQLGGYLEEPGS